MALLDQPTITTGTADPNIASSGVDIGAVQRLSQMSAPTIQQVVPTFTEPNSSTATQDAAPPMTLEDRVASYADRLKAPIRGTAETLPNMSVEPKPQIQSSQQPKDQLSAMMAAISDVESGGRYGIVGGVIPSSGDRAYGKYQVMGANIPSWTKEATGMSVTPEQFLKNPAIQDAVARYKMNQYYQKFGTIGDVASVWLSGRPLANNASKDQVTGISVPQYASRVMNLYKKYSNGQPTQPPQQQASGPSSRYGNIAQAMFGATGKMTTPFGGQTKFEGMHPGVDLAAAPGTPIRAFATGVVVAEDSGKKQGDKGYGNYVIVKDPYGNLHRYSHLRDEWVKVGDPIFTGQDLGSMGNSGSTYSSSGGTGTHLDYRIADAHGKYLNPTTYLNQINKKA